MNNVKELASAIAKADGHKSESIIGDIREILSILADMSYKSPEPLNLIKKLGVSRAKRKKKPVPTPGQ